MNANGYVQAGPIMAGLAAMGELLDAGPVSNVEGGLASATFALSANELLRMIENVADQISEVAAQMVDLRKRLDALDQAPQNAVAAVERRYLDWNEGRYGTDEPLTLSDYVDALRAQQVAAGLPLQHDMNAACWRPGSMSSASFASDQSLVELKLQAQQSATASAYGIKATVMDNQSHPWPVTAWRNRD